MSEVRENVRRAIRAIIDVYEHGNAAAFGRRLNVSRQTVSNWLNGWSCPDIEMVALICRVYGVDGNWMLLGDIDD